MIDGLRVPRLGWMTAYIAVTGLARIVLETARCYHHHLDHKKHNETSHNVVINEE